MRKADEDIQRKIEELIEAESDPRERARLLILLAISRTLVDNVVAVREVTEEFRSHRLEFETHREEQLKLINQGRGAWKVIGVAVLIIQGVLGYVLAEHMSIVNRIQGEVMEHSRRFAAIDERHRKEELTLP